MSRDIKTPEFVMQMTEAEYKAWVEEGKFPERLKPMLKKEAKKNAG